MALSALSEIPDEPRTPSRPRRITSEHLHDALVNAGVVRAEEHIRRIVIDAQAGQAVVIHVERFGDARLLDVVRGLDGVEIREAPTTRQVQRQAAWLPYSVEVADDTRPDLASLWADHRGCRLLGLLPGLGQWQCQTHGVVLNPVEDGTCTQQGATPPTDADS